MRWAQIYDPLGHPALSTLASALPVVVLLGALGVLRWRAHTAALAGLATALLVAVAIFGMPPSIALSTAAYGAAYGLLPIGWIVLNVIFLYQLTEQRGLLAVQRESITSVTRDRRLQLLLVAFCFGAFFEGASGFGTPVAVTGAVLIGLGFTPLLASGLSLIANTAPVAFGALGTPIIALQSVTSLDLHALSAMVGRQLPFFSILVPFWLVWAFAGWRGMAGVWPAALVAGVFFAVPQFLVSNYHGPCPWLILSAVVFVWGLPQTRALLDGISILRVPVPGLHGLVQRMPPVVAAPRPEPAIYAFNYLSATGSGILLAALIAGLVMRYRPAELVRAYWSTIKLVRLSLLTIAAMLALGFTTRYSGLDATLGLAFARTGVLYPFFGTLLGWLGVALTGSDTSSNVLFGSLQRITAEQLSLSPILMAAANSSGGVMGKMIDAQSIVVASTATRWYGHEGEILRYVFLHSLALACLVGLLVVLQAYVFPFSAMVLR